MEYITKFVLVTVLFLDSGKITENSVLLSKCPDSSQYYSYMEKRAKDEDEDIKDWRAACVQFDFIGTEKAE